MSMMEWIVIIGGISSIAWINWYFFLARQPVSNAGIDGEGVQEVAIVVEGGYHPAVVSVKRDRPVRLVFGFRGPQVLARLPKDHARADAGTDRQFRVHLRDEHAARSAHRARLTRRKPCRPRLPWC